MARTLRIVLIAVFLASGCGGGTPPQPRHHADTTPARLTRAQACRRLLADMTRNGGKPDLAAVRYVADHVVDVRLARDARTVFRDLAHENISPLGLLLLQDDCSKVGVRLPVP